MRKTMRFTAGAALAALWIAGCAPAAPEGALKPGSPAAKPPPAAATPAPKPAVPSAPAPKPSLAPMPAPVAIALPAGGGTVEVEAVLSRRGAEVVEDAAAGGGKGLRLPAGSLVEIRVRLEPGTYAVALRGRGPARDKDAALVTVDGVQSRVFFDGEGWLDGEVTDSGGKHAIPLAVKEAGEHAIGLAPAEPGVLVDAVRIGPPAPEPTAKAEPTPPVEPDRPAEPTPPPEKGGE